MKRKFTFLIAAAVMLLTMVATTSEMWGQKTDPTTIFYENFGSTTSNTAYGSYTGYSATASMFTNPSAAVNTHYSGDGKVGRSDISAANLSNGYTGASGNSGCYHSGVKNTEKTIVQISNINISNYENLHLSFGALGGSNSHKVNVQYKIDNGDFTSLISNGALSSSSWTLLEANINGSGSSLTLKFTHTPGNTWTIRMDDIKVTGTASGGGDTPLISADDVEIAFNDTEGSIAYTLTNATGNVTAAVTTGNWLTLGVITENAVPFTCSANAGAERTATVTLSFEGATDKVVTVTQAAAPNNISDITEVSTAYTVVGTVVATNNKGFVIGDGTGYVYTYLGSAPSQAINDKVKIAGITGTYGHILQFTNSATITVSETSNYNNTPAVTIVDGPALAAYNTDYQLSDYLQFEGTLSTTVDGNNTYYDISVGSVTARISYPTNAQTTALSSLVSKNVRVKGYFAGTSTKNEVTYYTIMLESVEEVTNPTLSVNPTTAQAFTYVVGNGPSDYQIFTVTGTNLVSADITATVTSDYEITDDQDYSSSVTIASGDIVSVHLKAGLAKGTHNGTLTLSSTDAENVIVNLSGTVTGQTYTIGQYSSPATAHGAITFEPASPVEDGTEVTLTATPADGYDFTADSWVFYKQSGEDYVVDNTIVVTNSKITMPAYNIWVDATFVEKPIYAITKVVTPDNSGTVETDIEAWEGKTVTVLVEAANGYAFSNIVISKTGEPETTIPTTGSAASGFTFTMPAYAVTVTVTFTELQDYATIPFSYDGNGSPNPVPTGMTFYSIGNYDNSPKMKFDATGDYVIIYYHGEANKLNYTVKNNGFSGGQFDVLESVNGEDYTTVHSYSGSTLLGTMNESYTINSSSKYIKFIYTTKSSGNVALGAISIKNLPAPIDSWKLNDETITAHAITIGESYTFPTFVTNSDGTKTYTSSNTDVATINSLTGVINVLTAGNTTIKCATAETTNYLASEKSYILTVNPGATYTVTYHSNGEETIVTDVPAGNLNLTAPTNIPNGYDYVGWATTAIDGTSTSATCFTSYNLTANTDLYAVFAMESYEAITSAPTAGTYVLAYKKSSNEYKVLNGIGSGNTTYGTATTVEEITPATIGNNVINLAATANSGYYSMKFGEYYLGWQSGNSLQFSDEFSADNYEWSYEISGENVVIINKKDTDRKLQYNAQNSRFACYTSAQAPVMLFRSVNIYCTSVSPAPIPVDGNGEMTGNTTIPSGAAYTITTPVTVPEGITLTVNGTLGNDNPANLIIEDGGQVIVNNTGVQATFKKSVSHTAAKDAANWYTISSPVNNIATASVTNLIQATETNYDLYYYDEASQYWFNHKAAGHAVANMTNGKGYLYWNYTGAELSFPGELNSTSVNIDVTVTGEGNLAGFNLIGNPYSHNIYKGTGTAIPNTNLSTGFYTLSNAGAWTAGTDNTTAIKPGQGILVKATAAGTVTMTNTTANGAKRGNGFVKFIITNSQYEDVAYAMFENEEKGLNKINHRNASIPMLYIAQNEENYAIATMSEETQSFNLNFKAMTTGQYTLSYKAEGNYDYLHVIDRLTGEDVDMLLDGEYSFIASPSDNDARFIVKLGYNANNNAENDIFAYQNGNDIIVNGEGELQVFDVTGRMVMNQHVNGVQTVNVKANGVYIFKLNENVQKIVVR